MIKFPQTTSWISRLKSWAVTTLLLAFAAQLSGAEWPCWRGPNGNSISDEAMSIKPWPASGPRKLWQANVGTGFSCIAVSQGRLFTLGNADEKDTFFCLAADTGKILWSHTYASPLDPNLYEGGPSATPTVEGDRVYSVGKFGHVFCFDAATGAIRWQTNLVADLGIEKPTWGFAGSPLIEGEKLIFNAGGRGLALDKMSGRLLWLPDKTRTGYSSPIPFEHEGTRAVLLFSRRSVVATAVEDGRQLWSHSWATPFDMNIADPVIFNGDFLLTSYNRGSALLDVLGSSVALVWQNRNLSTILSPGVVIGNHLYAFHDASDTPAEGELKCLDLTTGTIAWSQPMWVGSMISADGKLIILTGNGELVLAEANSTAYTELARAKILEGRCWTIPSLSAGRLYCRNAAGDVVALELAQASGTGRPTLGIAGVPGASRVRLTWPGVNDGFQLEAAERIGTGANWSKVNAAPASENGQGVLETDAALPNQFFRLSKP